LKIVTYRELDSKNSLLPLFDHAFGWPFNPRTYETVIKTDPRLRDSPVGFFALEGGSVIGSVGVMDMATRTLEGTTEYVGGVYGVATLPSHVRRGVSTALMKASHEYFKHKGYRFSLLWTSRSLVAHAMYEKLGYADWLERPTAYKVLGLKRTESKEKKKATKLDLDRILALYNKYVRFRTGFVVRDPAYLKMIKRFESLSAKDCILDKGGYVIFKTNVGGMWIQGTWIREFVALSADAMSRLLRLVEDQSKGPIYDRSVFDNTLLQVYESHGYAVQNRSHGLLMAKPLVPNVSVKQVYGDKFYLTSLDFF
jgi:GNAT superfamily N-acetyltransferase